MNVGYSLYILSKPTFWFSHYYIAFLELVDIAQIEQAKCSWKGTRHTLKADLCSSLQPGDDELAPFGSRILFGLPNNHKWKTVTECAFCSSRNNWSSSDTGAFTAVDIHRMSKVSCNSMFHRIVWCRITLSFIPYNTGGPDVPKAFKNNSTCCNLVL